MIRKLCSAFLLLPLVGMAQLEIDILNTNYTIDFDQTMPGVNNGSYQGNGFLPAATSGGLSSEAWSYSGMSNPASLDFGDIANTGDATRGISSGGETTPGFYAYNTAPNLAPVDRSMGWLGSSSVFNPGAITLKIKNTSFDDTLKVLRINYAIKELNNSSGSSEVRFSYSDDNINFTDVGNLDYASDSSASTVPVWQSANLSTVLANISLEPDSVMYLKWTIDEVTNIGGLLDEMAIDDITLRAYEVNYLWDGTAWQPNDPSGVSTIDSTALVLAGSPAVISAPTFFKTLTMVPGAKFNTNGNQITLSPLDTSVFMADESGYSQIIGDVNGAVEYQMYYTADSARYFNVGIPVKADFNDVSGIPINITGSTSNTNVWYYDAADNTAADGEGTFKPAASMGDSTHNVGWQIYAGDGTYFGTAPFTISTIGRLVTGTENIDVHDDTDSNFNILPNPYPSVINWNSLRGSNAGLFSTYYMQDGSTDDTDYVYRSYNGTTGVNGGTQYIAPGMSYFVKITNGTSQVTFQDSHRELQDNVTLYRVHSNIKLIKLESKLIGTKYTDEAIVGFKPGLTDGRDMDFDGGKFFNGGYPNLYTVGKGGSYTYNGMDDGFVSKSVDLNFEGDYEGSYRLKLSLDQLPAVWTVELEDRLTNTFTDIRKNDYTFIHSKSNTRERFVLHFNQAGAIGLDEDSFEGIYSYVKGETLSLNLEDINEVSVEVFDASGRLMSSSDEASGLTSFDIGLWPKGVYLLNVTKNGQSIYSNKVVKQ